MSYSAGILAPGPIEGDVDDHVLLAADELAATHRYEDVARLDAVPLRGRFAEGNAVAIERGTPLSDVLHAQVRRT